LHQLHPAGSFRDQHPPVREKAIAQEMTAAGGVSTVRLPAAVSLLAMKRS
jgi:hypothetical protein